jgi:NAD(P)H-dependent FMN reductase
MTGALKNLLDLVPVEALAGKPVGIVAMAPRSTTTSASTTTCATCWPGLAPWWRRQASI